MKDESKTITDLRTRTKGYSIIIIRLYTSLPKTEACVVVGRQLLRSGTSVGAHYREAYRAKSDADFINKIQGGLQELDETGYWLELLPECGMPPNDLHMLATRETEELIAIFTAICRSVKKNNAAK
jgi:four helix bundle protein